MDPVNGHKDTLAIRTGTNNSYACPTQPQIYTDNHDQSTHIFIFVAGESTAKPSHKPFDSRPMDLLDDLELGNGG